MILYELIQSSDAKNLSSAVDAAYERYKYYDRLAEQERKEREAEARTAG